MANEPPPPPLIKVLFWLFLLSFFGGGAILLANLFGHFLPEAAFAIVALVVMSEIALLFVVGVSVRVFRWQRTIGALADKTPASKWPTVPATPRSRLEDPIIGRLIVGNQREAEITRLRLDSDGQWWAGIAILSWGSILQPGLSRLVMNDGNIADVVVDELRGDGTGGEFAMFRGYGPVPDWITRTTVYPGGLP